MTERVSVDKPADPGGEGVPRPACEECGLVHAPLGKSGRPRRWWLEHGLQCWPLVVIPALPLGDGIKSLVTPMANVKLGDGERQALNSGFELTGERETTVRSVVVEMDHPSVLDRAVTAGPSLLLAGLLVFLAYALWRVVVNTTAGPHQRPFTEKDERYLRYSSLLLWVFWWVMVLVELFGFFPLHLGLLAQPGPGSGGSFIVMGLALLVSVFARVYAKGRKAYTDMEKIV